MTRITALASLTSADPTDVIPIVDISATTTKKITKAALLASVYDGTDIAAQAITPTKINATVANAAARTALSSPFEGLECYQADEDATYIYDGSAWRKQAQWEELGRTILGSAGDTLAVTSFAARKHLRFLVKITPSGSITPIIRFNNDSAANYGYSYSIASAAAVNGTSQTSILLFDAGGANTYYSYSVIDVVNVSAEIKLATINKAYTLGTSAATTPSMMAIVGKWANTSAQITRIDITNAGTGDMAIGSELIVLGKD